MKRMPSTSVAILSSKCFHLVAPGHHGRLFVCGGREAGEAAEGPRVTSLHQSIAPGHIADAHDEEENRETDDDKIEHNSPR